MSRTSLACSLALALLAASGCAARPDTGGDDDGSDEMQPAFTNGVSTLAGTDQAKYEDGTRDQARFSDPVNVAWGPDGRLYVADFNNSKIRAVDSAGNTTTIIDQFGFIRPYGLLFLADGTLIASTDNDSSGNHNLMSGSVWKIDVAAKKATVVADAIGRPRGLAQLQDGRVAMSDEFHHVIRMLDVSTGAVEDLAGAWDETGMVDANGADARFSTPYGMVVRPDGSLIVCDFDNNRLRLVTMSGVVSTLTGSVAGFADGAMNGAQFHHPQAITANAQGEMFVADMDNFRVRKVTEGGVETVAGNGTGGYADSDNAQQAQLYGLEGLTLNKDGTMLYLADGNRGEAVPFNRIRQVKL